MYNNLDFKLKYQTDDLAQPEDFFKMPCCAVLKCGTYSRKTKGSNVIYHPFPKDPDLRKDWISKCERKNSFNVELARVCSKHFLNTDYERDLKAELLQLPPKKILKKTAIPSQNLPECVSDNISVKQPQIGSGSISTVKKPSQSLIGSGHISTSTQPFQTESDGNLNQEDPAQTESTPPCDKPAQTESVNTPASNKLTKHVSESNSVLPFDKSMQQLSGCDFRSTCLLNIDKSTTGNSSSASICSSRTVLCENPRKKRRSKYADALERLKASSESQNNDKLVQTDDVVVVSKQQMTRMENQIKYLEGKVKYLNDKKAEQKATAVKNRLRIAKINAEFQTFKKKVSELQKPGLKEEIHRVLGKIFTPQQIKCLTSKKKGKVNWDEADIYQGIILMSMSKKSYIYQRKKGIPLPSISTLQRWISNNFQRPSGVSEDM